MQNIDSKNPGSLYLMGSIQGNNKALVYVRPGETLEQTLIENTIKSEKKLLVARVVKDLFNFIEEEMNVNEQIKQQSAKGDLLRLNIKSPENPNQKMPVCFRKSVLKKDINPQIHQKINTMSATEKKLFDYFMCEIEQEMKKSLAHATFSVAIKQVESIESLKNSAIIQTMVIKIFESEKNTYRMFDKKFVAFLNV